MTKNFDVSASYTAALAASLRVPDFFANGDCVKQDPRMWDEEFPEFNDQGKAICAECPIAAQCLAWGNANESSGIWGGIGSLERKRIRRGTKFQSLEERLDDLEWRRDVASEMSARDVAQKHGKSEKTVYRWRDSHAESQAC